MPITTPRVSECPISQAARTDAPALAPLYPHTLGHRPAARTARWNGRSGAWRPSVQNRECRFACGLLAAGRYHDLDRLALVHRPVAVGNLVEADDPVEHAARFDRALEDVREQLFDVGADRGRTTADGDVAVE